MLNKKVQKAFFIGMIVILILGTLLPFFMKF